MKIRYFALIILLSMPFWGYFGCCGRNREKEAYYVIEDFSFRLNDTQEDSVSYYFTEKNEVTTTINPNHLIAVNVQLTKRKTRSVHSMQVQFQPNQLLACKPSPTKFFFENEVDSIQVFTVHALNSYAAGALVNKDLYEVRENELVLVDSINNPIPLPDSDINYIPVQQFVVKQHPPASTVIQFQFKFYLSNGVVKEFTTTPVTQL